MFLWIGQEYKNKSRGMTVEELINVSLIVTRELKMKNRLTKLYLKVECLVTVEDEYEPSQLVTQGFHWLRLTRTSRTWQQLIVKVKVREKEKMKVKESDNS